MTSEKISKYIMIANVHYMSIFKVYEFFYYLLLRYKFIVKKDKNKNKHYIFNVNL